jgi:hypothetical protein
VEVCYDNVTVDNTDFGDQVYGYSDPAAVQGQGNMFYQDGINCTASFTSVFYFFFGSKPHMQFGLTNNGVTIANALNASRTEYFDQNRDFYYYSSTGVLMAHIKNLAAFNYGCTQVTIDRAGTSASAFWNENTANYLMNKTFHVVPATNNSSGQYEITLYFTQAEKEGWEAVTGQTWNNIQLVKVDGQVNQVTPTNPSGAGNVVVVTPTRGTFGNAFTLTYTFTNGFSGFGAGIPGIGAALPVTLLDFKGKLQGDNILLNWSTSAEYNSKQFEIEKSYDGISFHNLTNVLAAGNSSTLRQYTYLDKEKPAEVNYYRLKMVDLDNRNKMSSVIVIRNPKVVQNVFVLNNPFTDYIDVRFAKIPQGKVKFVLTDISGKTLAIAEYSRAAQSILRFNTNSKLLSSGIYILQTGVDGKSYTSKVLKN